MGREIRMVPGNWEHPKDEKGNFKPLYDEDFESVARRWLDECIMWENNEHEVLLSNPEYKEEYPFFWQYDCGPPDNEYYHPKFENANCFQIYETVSDGTPVSPVFKNKEDMLTWLIAQGHSEEASKKFIETGFAFSMAVSNGKVAVNIDIYNFV